MARLTITLSDDVHRRLKLRAASSGETIGRLIERALDDQRELARARVMALLEKAWANQTPEAARLSEDELMEEAVAITHEVREEMRERARGAS
jgi:predicted CopG family antitoxin